MLHLETHSAMVRSFTGVTLVGCDICQCYFYLVWSVPTRGGCIKLPFLRAFRAWSCSLTCCYRVMFPLRAISGARVIRCIKRFVGDRRSRQACLSSVPPGGELSSRDRSRSICWAGVRGGEAAGVELSRSFTSTVSDGGQ